MSFIGALFKKPKAPDNPLTLSLDPNSPRKLILGKTALAGSFAFHGLSNSSRDLTRVAILSGHRCNGVTRVWADGQIAFSGRLQHGVRTPMTTFRHKGRAHLWLTWYDGRPDQVADNWLRTTSHSPIGWSSSDRLRGCSYVIVTMRHDKDNINTVMEMVFEVEGAPLYDRRLDTTAGGSGSQRWNDPSSWAYTDNAAVATDHYQLGMVGGEGNDKLIFGMGLKPWQVPYDEFEANADTCDEIVNGQPRYATNGILSAADDHKDNIVRLAEAMAAVPYDTGGRFVIRPQQARPIALTLTDSDLVSGADYDLSESPGGDDLVNTVRGKYREPGVRYKEQEYPYVKDDDLISKDGREFEVTLNLPLETSSARAQRIANIELEVQKRRDIIEETFMPIANVLEVGDWFQRDSNLRGTSSKNYEAIDKQVFADKTVRIKGRETDPSITAFGVNQARPVDLPGPLDPFLPIRPVAPPASGTGGTHSGGGATVPDGIITINPGAGDDLDRFDYFEVEYGIATGSGASLNITDGTREAAIFPNEGGTGLHITGLLPDTDYAWRIRGVSGDLSTEWSGYSQFTTGVDLIATSSQTVGGLTEAAIQSQISTNAAGFAGLVQTYGSTASAAQSAASAAANASLASQSAQNSATAQSLAESAQSSSQNILTNVQALNSDAAASVVAAQSAQSLAENARDAAQSHAGSASSASLTAQAVQTDLEAENKWAEIYRITSITSDRWTDAVPGHSHQAQGDETLFSSTLGTTQNSSAAGNTGGSYYELPEDIERESWGSTIKLQFEVLAPASSPASSFAVSYSSNQLGNSNWQVHPVPASGAALVELEMTWGSDTDIEGDFIGVIGDADGNGNGVLVRSIKVFKRVSYSDMSQAAAAATAASAQESENAAARADEAGQFSIAAERSSLSASTSAGQASSSQTSAAQSATSALASSNQAAQSASLSAQSETAAGQSAQSSSNFASSAATHADAAAQSATSSQNSASLAQTRASEASVSAGQAAASQTSAAGSASAAQSSSQTAANSATQSGNSATAAAGSATSAASSATQAQQEAASAQASQVAASTSQAGAQAAQASAAQSATSAAGSSSQAAQSATVSVDAGDKAAYFSDLNSSLMSLGSVYTKHVLETSTYKIASLHSGNKLYKNGSLLATLNAFQVSNFPLVAGDVIESDRPISGLKPGETLPSDVHSGTRFFAISVRNTHDFIATVKAFSDCEVKFFVYNISTASGQRDPLGQETHSQTLSSGQIYSFDVNSANGSHQQELRIVSSAPIICRVRSGGGDRDLLLPVSERCINAVPGAGVKAWSHSEVVEQNVSSGDAVNFATSSAPSGVTSTVIGDGAGSDMNQGVPVEALGDSYLVPHGVSDYYIVCLEPCTVTLSNSSGDLVSHTAPIGTSFTSPHTFLFGPQTGAGAEVYSGPVLFRSDKPFYLRTNDPQYDTEYACLGWRLGFENGSSAGAAIAAAESATTAQASETAAASSAQVSQTERVAAEAARDASASSASASAGSASQAQASETAAAQSATSSQNSASLAQTRASEASVSAGQAAASQTSAAGSASAAQSSSQTAANSATQSGNSATAAAGSATSAASSATQAQSFSASSQSSASQAATSASSASVSATQSAASVTAAAGSATSAAASATQAINASAGRNLLENSRFLASEINWTKSGNPWPNVLQLRGDGPWNIDGDNSLQLHQTDATASGLIDLRSEKVAVVPGQVYVASVYSGAYRCKVECRIEFRNASNGVVGYAYQGNTQSANNSEASGGSLLSGYKRIWSIGAAPASATTAQVHVRKLGTSSGSDSHAFLSRPQFSEGTLGQTSPGPWSEGSFEAQVTTTSAAVAEIDGVLSSSFALGVKAGTSGAELELIALEDGNTSNSAARISADNIILDGSVTAGSLSSNSVTAAKIEANAVTAAKISAGAVTANKIAANAVTADKINVSNLSAISANLGTISVGTANIANGAITSAKIGNLAVDTLQVADGAISAVSTITGSGSTTGAAVTIGSSSITSSGNEILIAVSFIGSGGLFSGSNSDGNVFTRHFNVQLWRGTTLIRTFRHALIGIGGEGVIKDDSSFIEVDQPPAGTYTYHFKIPASAGGGGSGNNISISELVMRLQELKK